MTEKAAISKQTRDVIMSSLVVILMGLVTIFLQSGILSKINANGGAIPEIIKDNAANLGEAGILFSLVALIVLVIITKKHKAPLFLRAITFLVGAAIIIISGASMIYSGFHIPEMVVNTFFMVFGSYILFRGFGKKFFGF